MSLRCALRCLTRPSCRLASGPLGGATACPLERRGMAGHSKWSNIRHVKAAKDGEKQRVAMMIVNRLKVVIREGGSSNPKHNYMLARVLEEAKGRDIPKSTLDNALKSIESSKEKGAKMYVEAKGVGNCMLVIEAFTDNPRRVRQDIQAVMKKYRGTIGDSGLASNNYDYKGVIYAPLSSPALSLDEATEVAIEVGAEEVTEDEDEDGTRMLRFVTAPQQLHSVKRELETRMATSAARLEYIAVTLIELTPPHLTLISENLAVLAEMPEIVRVFDNVSNPPPQ